MKILMLHNYYQREGGEDSVFAAEIALLRQYGHDVFIYTEDNRRLGEESPLAGAVSAIWSRRSQQKLGQLLAEAKPDIAHFHNTFLRISPAAYYTCRKHSVPVIQTLHNYRLLCPAAFFFRDGRVCQDCLGKSVPWPGVLHGCWRHSRIETSLVVSMLSLHRLLGTWQYQVDLYIALTDFSRQQFISGGLPPDKIIVKPNFLSVDPGVATTITDRSYALFVGRLAPEKGVRLLLQTWERLGNIPLMIAGDGPLMDEARAQVKTLDLKHVELLGRRSPEEVIRLMHGARFLVFPSQSYEGFPVTIAEAFACGLPVIVSQLGSMEEIVTDGETGLYFTPGNIEDLAAKVQWAWAHPGEIEEMGRAARQEYKTKYTAERNYQLLMDIYHRAMDSGSY